MFAQLCEYTKNQWNEHFQGNFMVYELDLDKAV